MPMDTYNNIETVARKLNSIYQRLGCLPNTVTYSRTIRPESANTSTS